MAFTVSHFGRKTNKATLPTPENPEVIGKENKTKNKNKFQLPKQTQPKDVVQHQDRETD